MQQEFQSSESQVLEVDESSVNGKTLSYPSVQKSIFLLFKDFEEQIRIMILQPDWEVVQEVSRQIIGRQDPGRYFYFVIGKAEGDCPAKKIYPNEIFTQLLPASCKSYCVDELAEAIILANQQNKKFKLRINMGKQLYKQEDANQGIRQQIINKFVDIGKLSKNIYNKLVYPIFSTSVPKLAAEAVKSFLITKLGFEEKVVDKTGFTIYVTHTSNKLDEDDIIQTSLQAQNQPQDGNRKRTYCDYIISFEKTEDLVRNKVHYKLYKIRLGHKRLAALNMMGQAHYLDARLKLALENALVDEPDDVLEYAQKCAQSLNAGGPRNEFQRIFDVQQKNVRTNTVRRKKKCVLHGQFKGCTLKVSMSNLNKNSPLQIQQEITIWCRDLSSWPQTENQFQNQIQYSAEEVAKKLNLVVKFAKELVKCSSGTVGFVQDQW